MPRLKFLELEYGLIGWIYFKDHGKPHIHVYKGDPENYEAMIKVEISTWRVLDVSGFNESTANKILKRIQQHEEEILEAWHEIQKK